jgi:hypothetical protein
MKSIINAQLVEVIGALSRIIARYQKRIDERLAILDADGVFSSLPAAGPAWFRAWPSSSARTVIALRVPAKCRCLPAPPRSPGRAERKESSSCAGPVRPSPARAWSSLHAPRCDSQAGHGPFFGLHMPQDPNADRPTCSVLRKLAFKWLRIIYRCCSDAADRPCEFVQGQALRPVGSSKRERSEPISPRSRGTIFEPAPGSEPKRPLSVRGSPKSCTTESVSSLQLPPCESGIGRRRRFRSLSG